MITRLLFVSFSAFLMGSLASCDRTTSVPEPETSKPLEQSQSTPEANKSSEDQKNTPDVPTNFASLPPPYSNADYSLGRRTFKQCGACHTVVDGGQNLVGPNLHGIFSRKVGSLDGFRYSSSLSDADFTWTPERVEDWLSGPNKYLPGNNMTFAGVRRPDARHAVIAYLMLESGYEADEASASAD